MATIISLLTTATLLPPEGFGSWDRPTVAFNAVPPKTRAARIANLDREHLEKERLKARQAGFRRYHDPGNLIAPEADGSVASFLPGSDRFALDFATEDKRQRELAAQRKVQELNKKREEDVAREQARWARMDAEAAAEQERLDWLQADGRKARKNQSGVPFDPVTSAYKDTPEGQEQMLRDEFSMYRATLRAHSLQTHSRCTDYNLISGENWNSINLPPRPAPASRHGGAAAAAGPAAGPGASSSAAGPADAPAGAPSGSYFAPPARAKVGGSRRESGGYPESSDSSLAAGPFAREQQQQQGYPQHTGGGRAGGRYAETAAMAGPGHADSLDAAAARQGQTQQQAPQYGSGSRRGSLGQQQQYQQDGGYGYAADLSSTGAAGRGGAGAGGAGVGGGAWGGRGRSDSLGSAGRAALAGPAGGADYAGAGAAAGGGGVGGGGIAPLPPTGRGRYSSFSQMHAEGGISSMAAGGGAGGGGMVPPSPSGYGAAAPTPAGDAAGYGDSRRSSRYSSYEQGGYGGGGGVGAFNGAPTPSAGTPRSAAGGPGGFYGGGYPGGAAASPFSSSLSAAGGPSSEAAIGGGAAAAAAAGMGDTPSRRYKNQSAGLW